MLHGLRVSFMPGAPFFYLGHAIEALWFVIDECDRNGDQCTLLEAMLLFRAHLDRAWDADYGGLLSTSLDSEHNPVGTDKITWVQCEGLVGLSMIVYHSAVLGKSELFQWAVSRFLDLHQYCLLHLRSSPGHWRLGVNRQGTDSSQMGGFGGVRTAFARKEHYHHPRCVLIVLQSLVAFKCASRSLVSLESYKIDMGVLRSELNLELNLGHSIQPSDEASPQPPEEVRDPMRKEKVALEADRALRAVEAMQAKIKEWPLVAEADAETMGLVLPDVPIGSLSPSGSPSLSIHDSEIRVQKLSGAIESFSNQFAQLVKQFEGQVTLRDTMTPVRDP